MLVLPGNPGSSGYYEAYIAALHAALHGRAEIHAVSHLGHASSKKARQYGSKVYPFQVLTYTACAVHLCHVCQQPTKVPYALLTDAT